MQHDSSGVMNHKSIQIVFRTFFKLNKLNLLQIVNIQTK